MVTDCTQNQLHEKLVREAKEHLPDKNILKEVAARFKILGEESRLKIMSALMEGELCVYHICEATDAMQSATSHQLRILKDNKFVKSRREGKVIYYSIADEHIKSIIKAAIEHSECE